MTHPCRQSNRRSDRGFTLVELLIVLVVIGVLVAIAIPNLLGALQRGRQKRTMEDMRSIATACATYGIDHGAFVALEPGAQLETVAPLLQPTYMVKVPPSDSWGGAYRYESAADNYTLTSHGRDRQPGGGGAISDAGTTTSFDNDIVLSGGAFVIWPEGSQN